MTHISPNDVVPSLRNNVAFSWAPKGLGEGLLSATNIENGEELRMRGFEYSLARMLDGHRTAREVVAAAERLGLPLTFADLEGFLKKLDTYHLLGDGAAKLGEDEVSPWKQRQIWDEATRERYREALREGRSGNLEAAVDTLDHLLEDAPQTSEARGLRSRLKERVKAHAPATGFMRAFADAEQSWQSGLQPEKAFKPSHRNAVIAAAMGVVVIAGALLFVPFPKAVVAPAILLPISSASVSAPRTGTVDSVQVRVGQWVEQGEVLFSYDVREPLAALEVAVGRLEKQRAEVASFARNGGANARFEAAQASVAKAEAALDRARMEAGDPLSEQVADAERELNWELEDLQRARQAVESQAPQEQLTELYRLETEVRDLQLVLFESEAKAPKSGAVTMLGVHPGDSVVKGMRVVQVDDNRQLKAFARIPPNSRGIRVGQSAVLISQGRATQTRVIAADKANFQMVVDNAASAFEPGVAEVQIQAKVQPAFRYRFAPR
jgi:multidrug efflux pump subunit AcrA (membrane-fusion protein)